jgi:alpha-N-arabinofuranosidase
MIAINLGTGTPQEAGYFIEYCNHPGGTTLSDLRVQHGDAEPYNFKLWCLGNEMDGPWQTGQMSADDYAKRRARRPKFCAALTRRLSSLRAGVQAR